MEPNDAAYITNGLSLYRQGMRSRGRELVLECFPVAGRFFDANYLRLIGPSNTLLMGRGERVPMVHDAAEIAIAGAGLRPEREGTANGKEMPLTPVLLESRSCATVPEREWLQPDRGELGYFFCLDVNDGKASYLFDDATSKIPGGPRIQLGLCYEILLQPKFGFRDPFDGAEITHEMVDQEAACERMRRHFEGLKQWADKVLYQSC